MNSITSLSRLAAIAGLTAGVGCGDNLSPAPGGPPPVAALSHEPAWVVERGDNSCFGSTAAVADVDGDGRPDLLVGSPRCLDGGDDRLLIYRGVDTRPGAAPGEARFFARDPIDIAIDWDNANPFPFVLRLGLSTGDVDGDGRADVLLATPDGVALYRGGPDLTAAFAAPAFRAPGQGFRTATFTDASGDGRDDIAVSALGTVTLYLAGGDGEPAFTPGAVIAGASPRNAGDVDGDGRDDLLVATGGDTALHLGCDAASPDCDGLALTPAWTAPGAPIGAGDLDGDGLSDVLLGDVGRLRLHATRGALSGVLTPEPVWTAQGDPLFPAFGLAVAGLGDVDGDGAAGDLGVAATGRMYVFTGPAGDAPALSPAWAFPAGDSLDRGHEPIYPNFEVIGAGDLDGDGHAEIVAGAWFVAPARVMVFAGGPLPDGAAPPLLPAPVECAAVTGGEPDLTVDRDVLARSVQIERRTFDADSCEILEGCVGGVGERQLLRFTVSIPNLGAGDVEVPGPDEAPELFEFDTCHLHDHLIDFASYELIGDGGVVVTGRKQGFFLVDLAPYCDIAGPPADAGELFPRTGISAGWADVYTAGFDCQWIDITGVSDGTYELRVAVDTSDIIAEADAHPNEVSVMVEIEGDDVRLVP